MTPADERARHRTLTVPLLAERTRSAFLGVAGVICLYAVGDWVAHRAVVGTLWALAVVQVGCVLSARWLLRGRPSWGRAIVVPNVALTVVLGTGLVSDAISNNPLTTAVSAVGAAVATAAFLPWGWGPQICTAVLAALTCAAEVVFVRGSVEGLAHPAFTGGALLLGSIVLAGALDGVRRDRMRADDALAATAHRASEEARIASVLARASEELASHLDEPDMLDRLHALAREALEVDWSSTFIVDERAGGLRLASTVGTRAELRERLAHFTLPLEWATRPAGGGMIEIADVHGQDVADPALLARLDVASVVGAPLACGGKLLGMQVHGRRSRTGRFSDEQRRLVTGLAHATALAMENSRRIAELEAASRLKTEFVATMSHELRTPLNVITGYAEMLDDEALGPLTDPQRETLDRVRRSASELLELVNATLDVGRLEAGRVPVERNVVDVEALCDELDAELRPLLAPGVALVWSVDPEGATVETDRGKLKTIVKNLAGNACKFTASGQVDVQVTWHGDLLSIAIHDTGVGIPADQLPFVFDMFRQVDGSNTRRFGGVGLGLHIVKRLVALLEGTVAVDSTPTKGSSFVVSVPAPAALRRIAGGREG